MVLPFKIYICVCIYNVFSNYFSEVLLVETNRQEPLKAEEIQYIAAVNICLHKNIAMEEIIPQHLLVI